MSDATFQLDVITPERRVFSGRVEGVVAPGAQGLFGVLRGHVSYITEVLPGPLTFTHQDRSHRYVIGGGFAQVSADRVAILADRCEASSEIDVEAARREVHEAEKALLNLDPASREYLDAQARHRMAIARVQAGSAPADSAS